MSETPETPAETTRHVLRIERYPARELEMRIDDEQVRVVRFSWTADVAEILYEAAR